MPRHQITANALSVSMQNQLDYYSNANIFVFVIGAGFLSILVMSRYVRFVVVQLKARSRFSLPEEGGILCEGRGDWGGEGSALHDIGEVQSENGRRAME